MLPWPQRGSTFGEPINDKAQQLVDLLLQADVETDLDKRAELYEQAQDLYADMVVTLPLFFMAEHITYRANIQARSVCLTRDVEHRSHDRIQLLIVDQESIT